MILGPELINLIHNLVFSHAPTALLLSDDPWGDFPVTDLHGVFKCPDLLFGLGFDLAYTLCLID